MAFLGAGFPDTVGIYRIDGGTLAKVIDESTVISGLPLGLTTLFPFEPTLDGDIVAFMAAYDEVAFLLSDDGGLTIEAQPGDAIPDVSGAELQDFFTCSIWNGSLGFCAYAAGGILDGSLGIYATDGGLHTVANVLTSVPGGSGTFSGFGYNVGFGAGGAAFIGYSYSSSSFGVYRGNSSLQVVADNSTSIPGGSGTFTEFADGPTIRGSDVGFRAAGSGGQQGVYLHRNALSLVADTSTSIPGGSGTFTGFSGPGFDWFGPALSGTGSVAFRGQGSGGQDGIYAKHGGTLIKVVAVGDTIDSKTVAGLSFGREGFDGSALAFGLWFTDSSTAIVRATLP